MLMIFARNTQSKFCFIYTMKNIFSIFYCFAFCFAHLSRISKKFDCNDENRNLGKFNHKFT